MGDFNKILGNESIKNYFRSAVDHKMISHAYILEGEKGCGKKLIAGTFAKLLQCEAGQKEPCGFCTSCIQMDHRNHPDVIWVGHDKPNVISVGEIRDQVINTIDIKPYRGPYKIYIIDEAEKMNNAAQNAILKTIEEPTEYAIIFLLTSNRGAFLPTILSRCILLGIKPVQTSLIKEYLMANQGIDQGMAEFYAGFSMGNLGRAIAISSSEDFVGMQEQAFALLREIHRIPDNEIDDKVKESKAYKDKIGDYFDIMRLWFRDLLIIKTTKSTDRVIFKTAIQPMTQQVSLVSLEALDKIFQRIDEAERQIRANVNFEPAMDMMFIEIKRMFDRRRSKR